MSNSDKLTAIGERVEKIKANLPEDIAAEFDALIGELTDAASAPAVQKAYSASEAAKLLGLTSARTRHLCLLGKFPHAYMSAKAWFIPAEDIENYQPRDRRRREYRSTAYPNYKAKPDEPADETTSE